MSTQDARGKGKTVLVTGITGFVGAHVALSTLRAGYDVRGVVRNLEKAEQWRLVNPGWDDHLKFVHIPDITVPGAFDDAVKGVNFILHVASPLRAPDTSDNEGLVLKPAIDGTLELLRSASKVRVTRVVITSAGKVYSEEDWFPVTYEDGVKSQVPYFVYTVSKTLAEQAAWNFMNENKPSFALTTLLPSIVLGEPVHPLERFVPISGTNRAVAVALDASQTVSNIPAPQSYTDVRDLGDAHILAAEHPGAANERFLIATPYEHTQWISTLRSLFPSKADSIARIPEGYVADGHHQFDCSKAIRVLGLKYRSPEESLGDLAKWIWKVEEANTTSTKSA